MAVLAIDFGTSNTAAAVLDHNGKPSILPLEDGQDTLPTYMLGQLRRVITPEINAISSALLAVSVLMVTAFFFLSRTRK